MTFSVNSNQENNPGLFIENGNTDKSDKYRSVERLHSIYVVEEAHKPEYETVDAFGAMCLNNDLNSIIKTNDISNRNGLDTISA